MTSKLPLMVITWSLALLVSFGLRAWGFQHPEAFAIRSSFVWLLLFSPSILLGIWLLWFRSKKVEIESSTKLLK